MRANAQAGETENLACSSFMDSMQSGCLPENADSELQLYLELQQKRLEENNLSLERSYTEDRPLGLARQNLRCDEDGEFKYSRCCQSVFRRRKYLRDGVRVFRRKSLDYIYIDSCSRDGGETRICDYYHMKSCLLPAGFVGVMAKIGLYLPLALSGLILLILIFIQYDSFIFMLFLSVLFFVLLSSLYFTCMLPLYLICLCFQLLLQLPQTLKCGLARGRGCIRNFYPDDFLYDMLEQKASLLTKLILLSPKGSCPYYTGPELFSDFSSCVDADYRGFIKFLSLHREDSELEARVRIYFKNTVLKDDSLRDKKENFMLKLKGPCNESGISEGLEGWTVSEFSRW